ncbi:7412_t:CDS:10 [Cetraspora pellucida]|uniref:7412_t:CDS:1 n=1 Tax=Cetraspora pellucida TaxID=1433469 RepID=A0A9N8Z9F9_9GLOM|nr:7412_t:CDS:10 [Cetraspora pellucida]
MINFWIKLLRLTVALLYILALKNVVLGEYRSINGTNNDKGNFGAANMPFVRDKMTKYYYYNNTNFTMILTPGNYGIPLLPVSNKLSPDSGTILQIYIPGDDVNYQSQYSTFLGPNLTVTQPSLAFNRSSGSNFLGSNQGTPFLDASHIYGTVDWKLHMIRDYGNKGKMKLDTNGISDDFANFGYPPKDPLTGDYILGNAFSDMLYTIFLREHNRKCDESFAINHANWDDERYFQEARKWVIALIQKITFYEYVSILLGAPLPAYTGYNASLRPEIDSFFVTTAMRYGHSEVSDEYHMVDRNGYTTTTLKLNQLQEPHLLEKYGVPTLAASIALQVQDEVDIFFADQMRYFMYKTELMDLASVDITRGRDHGVLLYNDAREVFNLSRAKTWSDISSDPLTQQRLQAAYGSVDLVEAFPGGLAEDHVNGSNLGPLFYNSYVDQWTKIRDFDRFWYESPAAGFTQDEIDLIHNTTLAMVINRNMPSYASMPTNIWIVQPPAVPNVTTTTNTYPQFNNLKFSNTYQVQWRIDGSDIYFLMTMQSSNAWFAIGLNPSDNGMTDADMIIISVNSSSNVDVGVYKSTGYQRPNEVNGNFITVLNSTVSGGYTQVELKRSLSTPNLKPITDSSIKVIYAFNPNSYQLNYHGGNRGLMLVNFLTGQSSAVTGTTVVQSNTMQLFHGIGMFSMWCILFPVAMSSVTVQFRVNHGILGTTVYATLAAQIGLGLLAMYGLAKVESAVSEFYYKIKNLQFLWPTQKNINGPNKRLHNRIPARIYESLPTYTWEEFNDKILTGACLVVAEGLVFDVHKWIKVHPGGQRILRRVIGTDITNDFFFDPNVQMAIISNWNSEKGKLDEIPTESALPDESSRLPLKRKKVTSHVPNSTARTIDLINSITFKNTRVAMHRHSKFATSRLATMVVGRISDYESEKVDNPIGGNGFFPTAIAKLDVAKLPPHAFRRFILINVEEVTRYDAEIPVKKFTFQIIHPFDKLPKILPGDYIEVMSYTNKSTIVRQYTALKGPTENTFSIIVKIYSDGVMSQHLHKQLKNFEIAVRGPFDVSERIVPTSSIVPNFEPSGLRYRPSTRHGTRSVVSSRYKAPITDDSSEKESPSRPRILLNHKRDDKCWDRLFLICGGSGITPGLQLIEYHLDQAEELNSDFNIHLLFANHSIEDIINYKYLMFLQENSDDKFTVDFILSKAPPAWKGYAGHIDDRILYHWMHERYKIDPPPKIPERPNINQSRTQSRTSYRNNETDDIFEDTTAIHSDEDNDTLSTTRGHSFISNRTMNSRPPTSVLLMMNEIQEYMDLLSSDDSQEIRIMVCGPPAMMDSVRINLGKLGFPDEKVIFIS